MALSFGASGTVIYSAASGTSVAPAYPTGITVNSALVLIVGQKPTTANGGTVTTPSGWTLRASLTGANDGNTGGYTTTLGADTGNCNIFVYTKGTVAGTESGSLSVTVGDNNVCWGVIIRVESSLGVPVWTYSAGAGKDSSAGNVSIVTGSMTLTSGDFIIGAMVIPTDVTTPAQFTIEAFAQTSTTVGTAIETIEPDSTTGNDIGGFIAYASVTAGGATGAVTMTATAGGTTTNVRGPGIVIGLDVNQVKYAKTQSDNVTPGDSTIKSVTSPAQVYTKTPLDTLTLYDNGGTTRARELMVNQGLSLADTAPRSAIRSRILSEAMLLLDENVATYIPGVGGSTYTQTQTDTLAVVDTLLRALERNKLQSDAVILADSLMRGVFLLRLQSDVFTLTDSGSDTVFRNRLLGEAVSLIDAAVASRLLNRAGTDVLAVTDAAMDVLLRTRQSSDSIVVTDSEFDSLMLSRQITDSASLSDARLASVTRGRLGSDAIAVTDEELETILRNRLGSDAIAVTDSIDSSRYRNRALADSLIVTDGVSRYFAFSRSLSDAITATDAFIKSIIGSGTVYSSTRSDGVSLTDSQLRATQLSRQLTESLALSDGSLVARRLSRLITDSLLAADAYAKSVTAAGAVNVVTKNDSISFAESVFKGTERNRMASDALSLTEEKLRSILRMRTLFDSFSFAEGVLTARWNTRVLADALGVTDTLIADSIPFIQYRYDVRVTLGGGSPAAVLYAPATPETLGADLGIGVLYAAPDDARLGASPNILLGGYN